MSDNSDFIKPPRGLVPKEIWEHMAKLERKNEILLAMLRYSEANVKIPKEWIEEFNDTTTTELRMWPK